MNNFEKFKILITGGAGYIGSLLIEKLLNCGHIVTTYDNFLYGQSSLNHLCSNKNFSVIKGDVRDETKLSTILNKYEIIIPLAALVGAPICKFNPVGAKTINYDSINFLLKKISKEQIVLMPTTNSAYGFGDKNNYCNEESKLNPISQYAIDKVNIEKELMQRENAISFRLATVFGMSPRMRMDLLVNDFVFRAFSDKFIVLFESHFKRNFIHIRDVCNVFNFSINNFHKMKGQIYNVGLSDANLSKKELCEIIKKKINDFIFFEDSLQKDPDQRNYIVSNEKIEKIGFKTEFSLDQGIDELIKGYQMLKPKRFSNI